MSDLQRAVRDWDDKIRIYEDRPAMGAAPAGPTCRCGMWPVEEYGTTCPSCPPEREPRKGGTLVDKVLGSFTDRELCEYARVRRILHNRDHERERRANALYEELRLLSKEQLIKRASFPAARQTLIAAIVQEEVQSVGDQDT